MTIALLGLPGSGKSTLLAAINAACWVDTTITIGSLGDSDREYINAITDRLDNCEDVGRTHIGTPGSVSLPVRVATEGAPKAMQLVIPDLSGEHTRMTVDDRIMPQAFAAMLDEATSIALCLRADQLIDPPLLDDLNREIGSPDDPSPAPERIEAVEMSRQPTQVVAVDILQEVSRRRPEVPVAVLLTAWDTQPAAATTTPTSFVHDQLPLLHQYLTHRDGPVSLWGVSAQGGSYEDPDQLAAMQSQRSGMRCRTWHADGNNGAFLLFLSWLIDAG